MEQEKTKELKAELEKWRNASNMATPEDLKAYLVILERFVDSLLTEEIEHVQLLDRHRH